MKRFTLEGDCISTVPMELDLATVWTKALKQVETLIIVILRVF